jgi:toxin CptA
MHSAPAVSYPVGRSHLEGGLLLGTGMTGLLAAWLWCAEPGPLGWRQGLYMLVLLLALVVAARAWRHSPQGLLRWDGQCWHWGTEGAAVRGLIAVHLDTHVCLLLSLQTEAGSRLYLWPERRTEPASWHALRCAVFAHRVTALAEPVEAGNAPKPL